MKGILSILAALCVALTISAQDTIYIDRAQWTNKENATEYAFATKQGKEQFKVEFYSLDGKLKRIETYSVFNKKQSIRDGELIQYYPDGKVRRKEMYFKDVCLEGQLWSEDGSKLPFVPYYVKPEYQGGNMALAQKLASTLRYPSEAVKSRIQGVVVMQFTIDKEGYITQPEVVRSVHPLLDEAALNALKQIAKTKKPNWTPGKLEGENIRVRFTLPANFRLP